MDRLVAISRIRPVVLLGFLAVGAMTTVPGWGASRLGSDHPLGDSAELVLRLALVVGIVALAGRQVAVVRRLRIEEAETARMRQELTFARRTQERFLPQELPVVPGLELWGVNLSSQEVSGDYYDIRDIPDSGRLVLAIADVSGKGVPAALLMSAVQAGLHSRLLDGELDIEKTMQGLNRLVHQDAATGRFVTMFLAEIDKTTRRLRYVRAGHDLPIVVSRDGAVRRLDEGDAFLGLFPHVKYDAAEVELRPGETLCLYTDGVTEAVGAGGEMFDEERLIEVLVRHRLETAEAIGSAVVEAVGNFSRLPRLADDATLVVVKVACGADASTGVRREIGLPVRAATR